MCPAHTSINPKKKRKREKYHIENEPHDMNQECIRAQQIQDPRKHYHLLYGDFGPFRRGLPINTQMKKTTWKQRKELFYRSKMIPTEKWNINQILESKTIGKKERRNI